MSNSNGKVIVTGASGHIRYHVACLLCNAGFEVDLLLRRVNLNIVDLVRRGARSHIVDFQNPSSYARLLAGSQCLFHCAAENTTEQQASERVLGSTLGLTRSLLTAATDSKIATIIYTSSVVVLGRSNHPGRQLFETDRTTIWESPYARGKAEADAFCERLIREDGLDIRRLYPSWVVGPHDLRGTPPHQVVRNFLIEGQRFYFKGGISIAGVESVARAHVAAWLRGSPQSSYVLGGDNITFHNFFSELAELSGKTPPAIFLPSWLVVAAAWGLKALSRSLGKLSPIDPSYAKTVVGSYSWYNSTKAIHELGYEIPPARQSLQSAIHGERKRLVQTYALGRIRTVDSRPVVLESKKLPPLLITGVPGWLGNCFVDRLINGLAGGKGPILSQSPSIG